MVTEISNNIKGKKQRKYKILQIWVLSVDFSLKYRSSRVLIILKKMNGG